jgi:hypothetical protein
MRVRTIYVSKIMSVELYIIGTKSCTGLEIDTRILAQFQGVYSWISIIRSFDFHRSTTGGQIQCF